MQLSIFNRKYIRNLINIEILNIQILIRNGTFFAVASANFSGPESPIEFRGTGLVAISISTSSSGASDRLSLYNSLIPNVV